MNPGIFNGKFVIREATCSKKEDVLKMVAGGKMVE